MLMVCCWAISASSEISFGEILPERRSASSGPGMRERDVGVARERHGVGAARAAQVAAGAAGDRFAAVEGGLLFDVGDVPAGVVVVRTDVRRRIVPSHRLVAQRHLCGNTHGSRWAHRLEQPQLYDPAAQAARQCQQRTAAQRAPRTDARLPPAPSRPPRASAPGTGAHAGRRRKRRPPWEEYGLSSEGYRRAGRARSARG